MAATYDEQLASVQAAIGAIEAGTQSVSINGRQYVRADLKSLYDREAFLRRQVARAERGGMRTFRAVPVD